MVGLGGLEEDDQSDLIGYILCFSGTLFAAIQLIAEEFVLRKYKTHPLRMVGAMGIFELPLLLALLVILNLIPCSDEKLCRFGYFENS